MKLFPFDMQACIPPYKYYIKKGVHIDLKITFQRFCMNIFFPMSFLTYYLFFITSNWNNVQTQVHVHGSPLTHSSCHFVWPQIYLFLNIMHPIEPLPSHSSWPIPLHLWSTYRFLLFKDSPSLMFAWCKMHCSLWHYSRIFFCFQC